MSGGLHHRQLSFDEKRDLIASTLSIGEFLNPHGARTGSLPTPESTGLFAHKYKPNSNAFSVTFLNNGSLDRVNEFGEYIS